MEQGTVVKIHSNYYYVLTGTREIECFLRGKFKKQKIQVLVGDKVKISLTGEKTGVIEEVIPRISFLQRPAVANLQQVIIVFSVQNPDPNWLLFDRFLLLAEQAKLEIVLCFNKIDLVDKESWLQETKVSLYEKIGYKLLYCSAKQGIGLDQLKDSLYGKTSVFAGPSGVGKSALLNALQNGLSLKTGELSAKIQRGKHTTRHVELMELDFGGFVVDAPGFSLLTFAEMEKEELQTFFPEMERFLLDCPFAPCLHWKEENCAVKKAVADGLIHPRRYEHYLKFLQEIVEKKRGRK